MSRATAGPLSGRIVMLGALTTLVVSFARAHRLAAYGLIGLVAFSESLPLLGAFVPGDAIILGLSALVPTGALNLGPLMLGALLGAVLGDGFAFWLGHHYHGAILGRWPFRGRPRLVARGTAFLQRHGGKSVFVARFTPGVRAVVPVLAGVLRMDIARFYWMNVLSALLWSPAHILAGAAIGASFVLLGAVAGRLALIAAIVLALLVLLYMLARYLVRRVPPLIGAVHERLRQWAAARDSWLARQLLALLDPTRRELPGLALLVSILLASLWLFFGVLQDVIAGDPLVRANEAVFHFLQGLRTEWVDQIMVAITELGDASVAAAVALAATAWLAWRRNWRAVAHLIAVAAVTAIATIVLKLSLHIDRPDPIGSGWDAFAFPSGHSAANAALYGFLAIIAAWELPPRGRLPVTAALALLVGAIAFSRIYLGAHWLSDVLAGGAFGVAAAALLAIAYLWHDPPPVGATGLCVTVGVVLLGVGGLHIESRHRTDMNRYAVRQRIRSLPLHEWWRDGWRDLPERRADLIGGAEEPLTVQWAGRRAVLREELAAAGWHTPPRWMLRTAARWFEPHVRLGRLPVLPHLDNGHREALVLVHAVATHPDTERLVLRLWRSGVELTRSGTAALPLFIGTVIKQRARRAAPVMTLANELGQFTAPRNVLAAALPWRRLAARPGTAATRAWDGCVLLARAERLTPAPVAAAQPKRPRRRHQRRAATAAQTASMIPTGQAPCRNP